MGNGSPGLGPCCLLEVVQKNLASSSPSWRDSGAISSDPEVPGPQAYERSRLSVVGNRADSGRIGASGALEEIVHQSRRPMT
jgi:hypothetical protein